jgi:hypothetical protein
MNDLDRRLRKAVRFFWTTRTIQADRQGAKSGQRDYGERTSVTAGAHLNGFIDLIKELLVESGLPESTVHCRKRADVPGYFRPEKSWDLVAVAEGHLLAVIECKSQVGPSFGNNYNNRTEESLGSAIDLWAAFREGAYAPSQRPWLGYFMLLEHAPESVRPVSVTESHFRVFEEFRGASYAKRYEILLTKLLRERLYDGACLLLSSQASGTKGTYSEPSQELAFASFASSLMAHAIGFVKSRGLP